MSRKIEIEKSVLLQKYVLEKKTIREVASDLGYSVDTIRKRLKEYNLSRSFSESQKIRCEKYGAHNQFELDYEVLNELYVNQKLTTYEVADRLGCSQSKVWKSLIEMGINRSVSESMLGREPWNKGLTKDEDERILIASEKISKKTKGRKSYWEGKKRNKTDRDKMSKSHKGKIHSTETKKRMRKSHIRRIENHKLNGNQLKPCYNPNSIPFIEQYGKKHGYQFQHAENGGEFYIKELGYWVDGYDKEKNVVLEFDENYHIRQHKKDSNRQKEIINHLGCRFIRLNENGEEILNIKYYES